MVTPKSRMLTRGVPVKFVNIVENGSYKPANGQKVIHQNMTSDGSGLFVVGGSGTGKTTVLCRALYVYARDGERAFLFATFSDIMSAITGGTLRKYVAANVLSIDDINLGDVGKYANTVLAFLHSRSAAGKTTFLSSSAGVEEIKSWCKGKFSSWVAGNCVSYKLGGVDLNKSARRKNAKQAR